MLLTLSSLMRSPNVSLVPAHCLSVSTAPEFRIFLGLDKMVIMAKSLWQKFREKNQVVIFKDKFEEKARMRHLALNNT